MKFSHCKMRWTFSGDASGVKEWLFKVSDAEKWPNMCCCYVNYTLQPLIHEQEELFRS